MLILKSYCTCPANQALLWMALFRVNGLIQPKSYRSDSVRKLFGMAMSSQRARVMTLYRTLLHLGREYPQVRPGLENLAQLPDLCSGLHIFPGSLPRSISKEQRPSSPTGLFSINVSTGDTCSSGCPKKSKSPNFGMSLTPVVFIG